ncbi:hypothetical protein M5K25_006695 [Dendrobium thyrsiflorum]|uniref:Uncharacterized protein n=1 Tax=Dendrobium thyrsiflorum TaxID=117978 RepID=A0ABD0VDH3_DENTH
MLFQRNQRRPIQEPEIEDLLQEIARLKLRLSRIELRKDLSPLTRDFNGVRLQGKYAPITDSRSFVPTKSLCTGDNNEGISDVTPTSIEFGFEEFEDTLSKSSSLPLYDGPVYDVYDDDIFDGVLDLEQLTSVVNDDNKREGQHNINDGFFLSFEPVNSRSWRTSNESVKFPQLKKEPLILLNLQPKSPSVVQSLPKSNMEFLDLSCHDLPVDRSKISISYSDAEFPPASSSCANSMLGICLQTKEINNILVKAAQKIDSDSASDQEIKTVTLPVPLHAILKWEFSHGSSNEFSVKDPEAVLSAKTWEYPDRFSQPNPPPYGGQPDIFL